MNKPWRAVRLVVLLSVAVLLSAGCWDRREIEERTSVVAIAIDKSNEQPGMILLTVQIPIPIRIAGSGLGSGGGGGKQAVKTMSATGVTVVDAFQNLQKRLNQELFYGHTRIIAIGEEVAKAGISQILDPFRRDPQIRRLLWPIVVQGEGRKLLTATPALEQIPTVFIMTLIENGARSGRIPDINLGDFYIDLTTGSREPYLNYVQVNKDDIKWSGVALFLDDRMIGTLDERETWRVMRVREKKDGGSIAFPYKGNPAHLATINTEFVRSSKKVTFQNGNPVVRITIKIEGNLLEKTFQADLKDPQTIRQIEQDAVRYLEENTAKLVHKLQKQYKTDALGIGSYIKAYHPTEWNRMDWKKQFSEADIHIGYIVKLRNTGMELH
ncbi:Ger(x)C family spore germination protein [Paenibacillus ginsengarvi]|uniref:Ger(X)C family spore germination protein n=1 Tax=Paenibacillus ginsengarvi TaxID=400777 RepID=A0A3B0CKX6_9BACL|nr:Ger(x)C family spore germination protein [Paenibacillus ginsengarvi]RKN85610.1 Ger(x)C family spore germination protein [Paenibacillus ginsengarvi]